MGQCFSQLKNIKDKEIDGIIHQYNNLNSRTFHLSHYIKKKGERRYWVKARDNKERRKVEIEESAQVQRGKHVEGEKRGYRQRKVVCFQAKITFTNKMARTLH